MSHECQKTDVLDIIVNNQRSMMKDIKKVLVATAVNEAVLAVKTSLYGAVGGLLVTAAVAYIKKGG